MDRYAAIHFVVYLLLFYVTPGLVCAGEAAEKNEPLTIYITGSNLPVSPKEPVQNTTVITKEQIKELNPRSVPQLLKSVSGLHVENAAARGGLSAVYLRGGEPNYTAVFINGIRVNDPNNSRGGAFDFSLLDVDTVQRIEVVKGPVSSVYGSAAMAGVINIITSPSADKPVAWSVKSGSRGYRAGSVTMAGNTGKSTLSLSTGYSNDGQQIEGSQYQAAKVILDGETWVNNDTTKLNLSGLYQHARSQSFPEASGGAQYAALRDTEHRHTSQQTLGVKAEHHLANVSRVNVKVNHYQTHEQTDSPGVAAGVGGAIPASTTVADYRRQQISIVLSTVVNSRFDVSAGIEADREQGESNSIIFAGGPIPADFELTRNVYAGFGEFRYQFTGNLQGSGGARLDAPRGTDNELSPRLGVSYRFNQSTLRFNWSRGFKLPGFFALGHPLVGNPDFVPETSESYELSLTHRFHQATTMNMALFNNRYFDVIDYDDTVGRLVQRDEVTTKGIELSWERQYLPGLSVNWHYTAMKLNIVNSDAQLTKRPSHQAGATVDWQWTPAINLTGQASYVGTRRDFANPTGERTLGSYTRLNVALGWQWNKRWRGQLAVDNVFNKEYEEAVGFIAPDVGVRLSVEGDL
ncbi:MAG: TonB-dependent receptor [Gammaproteobacteria bacterium]